MELTRQRKTALISVAALFSVGGLGLLALSAWYGISYLSDTPSNPYRSEYLEGVGMSLVIAFPLWLVVSAATYPLRFTISRRLYVAVNAPAVGLGLMQLGMLIFIAAKIVTRHHAA
jgi:hypothetical protein